MIVFGGFGRGRTGVFDAFYGESGTLEKSAAGQNLCPPQKQTAFIK
jgi:hypothetical protein